MKLLTKTDGLSKSAYIFPNAYSFAKQREFLSDEKKDASLIIKVNTTRFSKFKKNAKTNKFEINDEEDRLTFTNT